MKKRIIIIISLLIVLSLGTTYAWFSWNSSNNNVSFTIEGVNIIYNGGNDITGIKLIPVTTKEKGVNDNTAIYKEITVSANKEVNFNLYLDVETLGNGLKDETFVWEIYKGNTLINNGNFKNINVGDTINLMLHEKTSTTTQTYKLYIYIDGSVDNEVTLDNQAYSFKLHADANDNPNEYVVALDADGGNVSNNKILVNKNQTYGTLPTPTREGYTFLGWNGKNILNKLTSSLATIQNETQNKYWASTVFNNAWVNKYLKPSTTYTISYDVSCISIPEHNEDHSKNLGFLLYSGVSGYASIDMGRIQYYIPQGTSRSVTQTFTTPANLYDTASKYKVIAYSNLYKLDGSYNISGIGYLASEVILSNIMLEEGSTATTYEPYYITSSTVVQENNHTLTAIWE